MVIVSGCCMKKYPSTSGANCRSCDGCYSKSKNEESNGRPVYISERTDTVTIANSDHDGSDNWYFMIEYDHIIPTNLVMYESMEVDGLQGKYASRFDDSIATVNCTRVCPYNLK